MRNAFRFDGVRPLVRYVDEEQAVIDAHFATLAPLPGDQPFDDPQVDVLVRISADDGFEDEGTTRLVLRDGAGSVRFDMVQPHRWWPANLGDQPLYDLTLRMMRGDELLDETTLAFGLTSVRRDRKGGSGAAAPLTLLVNGQVYTFESVLVVDRVDESGLLPASGDSLLIVRDHYGPSILYDAADRAGILVIQCVPITGSATLEPEVASHVSRLSPHPSLAGWYVGHLGPISDRIAERIRRLDPVRTVFRELPPAAA